MRLDDARVAIVGGSIAGLSAAVALRALGANVVVFERGPASFAERGGGLGIDLDLCRALAPTAATPPHVTHGRRRVWVSGVEHEHVSHIPVTSYGRLWRWLYEQLPEGVVNFERAAIGVTSISEGASLATSDGRERAFDLVVAADGGASELRRRVLSAPTVRQYAGYVLWRGVVSMDQCGRLGQEFEGRLTIANRIEQHFVAYPIPHPTLGPAINWGWYYPTSPAELAEIEDRVGIAAPHVLGRCGEALEKLEGALTSAAEFWPGWVSQLVKRTIAGGVFAPHPVFELGPDTMVRDRLVLVGDAAHLASPITGSGGRMAMADAIALRDAFHESASLTEGLAVFNRRRTPSCRAVVEEGLRRGAPFRGARSPSG